MEIIHGVGCVTLPTPGSSTNTETRASVSSEVAAEKAMNPRRLVPQMTQGATQSQKTKKSEKEGGNRDYVSPAKGRQQGRIIRASRGPAGMEGGVEL